MKKLILQKDKECFICHTPYGLHHHEIFFGRNRQKSINWGCQVWLCGLHHNLGNYSPHQNHDVDMMLKRFGQEEFEKVYGHELFMEVFKKNYL